MTNAEIFFKIASFDSTKHFIPSLNFIDDGIKLSNLLKLLSDNKIEFNLLCGFKPKHIYGENPYDKFTKCKIKCKLEDIKSVIDSRYIDVESDEILIINIR